MHLDGSLHRLEQHAVDAIANPGLGLFRLDMNVAGAFADGVADEVVDEFDDGRLSRHRLEVFRIVLLILNHLDFRHVVDDVVQVGVGFLLHLERLTDGVDVVGAAHHDPDVHSGLALDILNGKDVRRLTGGHQQGILLDGDRHDTASLNEGDVQLLEGALLHLLRKDVAEFQSAQLRLGVQHVIRLDPAFLEQPHGGIHTGAVHQFPAQSTVLFVRDLAHLQQDVCGIAHVRMTGRLRRVQVAETAHFLVVGKDRRRRTRFRFGTRRRRSTRF